MVRRGAHRIRHGAPIVVTYDSTSDDEIGWGFGLGCNGVVDVMLEQIDAATAVDPLLFASECIAAETRGVLVTVFRSDDETVRIGARLAVRSGAPTQTSLPDGALRDGLERDVLGANAAQIAPVLAGSGATVVDNATWDEGIASSIRAAATWAKQDGASALAMVLADQRLLDRVHVDRLVDAGRSGAPAAASLYGGALGVPALFDPSL